MNKKSARLRRNALERKAELRRGTGLTRKSELKSKRKPPVAKEEKQLRGEFWRAVTDNGRALDAVDGEPGRADDPIQAHHVIPKERLKKYAASHGIPVPQLVWDPRNGMPVRRSTHARHTSAFRRIGYAHLPQAAVDFASELGLDWVLEQAYPSNDDG